MLFIAYINNKSLEINLFCSHKVRSEKQMIQGLVAATWAL